jgi:hypothetical protein
MQNACSSPELCEGTAVFHSEETRRSSQYKWVNHRQPPLYDESVAQVFAVEDVNASQYTWLGLHTSFVAYTITPPPRLVKFAGETCSSLPWL